ncbi:helix-turn-helix domain-containing protein [Actinophytocola sp.]|uniref:TetR/AcrR family transcriptional regulator n=1 Tax=Actinophytocola sp. TaxID=1872138 RepID=UPI002ED7AC71
MSRLSRVETQERNRAKVLAAARSEFAERGFRDAKIDEIAERAELTRGAVYSNFPGKRALYFAVLAEAVAAAPVPEQPSLGRTRREALGGLARAWVSRLDGPDAALFADLFAEVPRRPYTQLLRVNALLLGLALERLEPVAPGARLVRLASTALTILHGARSLSTIAPGFEEPFDVVSACEQLASAELNDWWAPPAAAPAHPADDPWSPPPAVDLVTGRPAELGDGVVAVLGLNRLASVEQAVRGAFGTTPAGAVTAVLVTGDPAELALARLTITELSACLRQSFPEPAWPALRVVIDPGPLAAAAGIPAVSDETEVAFRVEGGRILTRAEGTAACQAIAGVPTHR